jgi:ABC-2 type transport system ATP-binding protein
VIVRTAGLRKEYGATVALAGIDLAVPDGSIYGLVGPNGAGKTTLLGILSGLRRASAGTVHLGVGTDRMAVLPDTPQFEPWLTAREVVDLARALTVPDAGPDRVHAVLELAGLEPAADRRVGGFSRGMLQRLGIAAAVVGEPDLLLLDEPCSALDPFGRREVLDLVARLRGRATVVFSSHILSDIQEVADTVGILRAGELLFQGSLAELLVGRAVPAYLVRVRNPELDLAAGLRNEPWVTGVAATAEGEWRIEVESLAAAEERLAGVLAGAGAHVIALGPAEVTLEQVFLELTS